MNILLHGNTKKGYSWFIKTAIEGFHLNNCKIYQVDYKSTSIDDFKKKLWSAKPRIVLTHMTFHGFHDIPKLLQLFRDYKKSFKTKIIHTLGDARKIPRYEKDISGSFDFALINQKQYINKFQKYWKIPVFFWPYSSLIYNKIANPIPELSFKIPVFTGSPEMHQDRKKFINDLSKLIPIKIIKTNSKEDLRNRTRELSASAKCILGLCTGYDIGGYIDVRPFQYLGSGAFMIMRKFKWMDNIIPEDLYISFDSYDNPQVVFDLWKKYKKMDTKNIREKAFKFIQENHSSKIRMGQVLCLSEK